MTIFGGQECYPDLMIGFSGINHPEIEWDVRHSFDVERESIERCRAACEESPGRTLNIL
ncbi:hypothetical protein BCEP27_20814 [Burkholderia cepacia]